uniref:Tyr recombinase domain-containing protein n=1 Tax=Caulerpa ashmeadii TaxID=177078 RepID=A0A6B9VX01_9CHLO|nr:hypothetical protein, integrase/recombinase [Caulerpa ashmeadii]QHQ73234.1 hypothetical protein, integrase/recombinase [Caulerpa ashmeadii]
MFSSPLKLRISRFLCFRRRPFSNTLSSHPLGLGRPFERVNHDHFLQELNVILGEYCKEYNIVPKYTTHCFRHNFITSLWKDTGDIVFVSQYMNHSRVETTNNYIKTMNNLELEEYIKNTYNDFY